jgi:hypothetical protein
MTPWSIIALAAAAAVAVTAIALVPTTAVASPSDLEVSPSCGRITIKDRATLTAKVGLAVLTIAPADDTQLRDLFIQVMQKIAPQCSWPPPVAVGPCEDLTNCATNPMFAGLALFGAPKDEISWIEIVGGLGEVTWGDAKNAGVLDFAPAPGGSSQALAAGVAFMDALVQAAGGGTGAGATPGAAGAAGA